MLPLSTGGEADMSVNLPNRPLWRHQLARWCGRISVFVIVGGAGWIGWRYQSSSGQPVAAIGQGKKEAALTQPSVAQGRRNESGAVSGSAQETPVQRIMGDLRATYRSDGLPARIRLQGELSALWEKELPKAAVVAAELQDKGAPSEHRVYIAQLFRNLAKQNRLEAEEAADVVDHLLGVIADVNEAPLLRGQFAIVLAGFDKSSEAVRTVASLLDVPSDDAGYLAVTALRHTATDEAAKELFDFLQRDIALLEIKPKATAAALLALAGYRQNEVASIAKEIVTKSGSAELLQGAIVCLSKSPSSMPVVEAIVIAHDNAARIPGVDSRRILNVCVGALKNHARFLNSLSSVDHGSPAGRAKALLEEGSR